MKYLHVGGAESHEISMLDAQTRMLAFLHFTFEEVNIDISAFSSEELGGSHQF